MKVEIDRDMLNVIRMMIADYDDYYCTGRNCRKARYQRCDESYDGLCPLHQSSGEMLQNIDLILSGKVPP